jgi:hypothetical protein
MPAKGTGAIATVDGNPAHSNSGNNYTTTIVYNSDTTVFTHTYDSGEVYQQTITLDQSGRATNISKWIQIT